MEEEDEEEQPEEQIDRLKLTGINVPLTIDEREGPQIATLKQQARIGIDRALAIVIRLRVAVVVAVNRTTYRG